MSSHLHDELSDPNSKKITIETKYGRVTGGTARNGAIVFLEVPYALPPGRFKDPEPLDGQFRYEDKAYIRELSYAAQPTVDGQATGTKFEDKVGYGSPSENPLFLNIVLPPSYLLNSDDLPVRVYIHGGFLQFGSPHGASSRAHYIAVETNQIWINVGYRLSAFGFLACDKPKVPGNFGFKDVWLALLWIKENIHSFNGDVNNIQLTGLSAGAHVVHQVLHHVSRLSEGVKSPFQSAMLQSNAILLNPKTPSELRDQFRLFSSKFGLDPDSPDVLEILQDSSKVPTESIIQLINSGSLSEHDSFRGCLDGEWLQGDPMAWQRSGNLARSLKAKGVRSIIIGDVKEEWYLYSIAWPVSHPSDIVRNVSRCFPVNFTRHLVSLFPTLDDNASQEAILRSMGDVLAAAQVYLPIRLFHYDLWKAGFPVLRYDIRWAPFRSREEGLVTHGSDRAIWAFKLPDLHDSEVETIREWIKIVNETILALESQNVPSHKPEQVLTLSEDRSIGWKEDLLYQEMMQKVQILLP